MEDFTFCLNRHPGYADALIMRGAARNQQDEFQAAIDDLSAAIGIDAKNPEAYYQRSLAWHSQGNLLQALSDVRKALAESPQDARYGQWVAFLENKSESD